MRLRFCLLCLIVLAVLSANLMDKPVIAQEDEDTPAILVIAHQGGDGLRPSNTMMAFEHAVELGVNMLELDIHSTSDGVLVVIHDETVDRTTDGEGRVQDFTFEALQMLDAGYNWPTLEEEAEREDHPFRGEGATIPALEEVFETFPDMPMTIEIKQAEPSIVEPFCEMLIEYEMTEQVIVASFHEETLFEFREACPDVATSASDGEVQAFFFANLGNNFDKFETPAVAFQVPEYRGNIQVVTPEFVENAHALGILVQVWTVNEPKQIERMIELGVDGIITDYPDRVLEALGRLEESAED